jgi:hypothetical protein
MGVLDLFFRGVAPDQLLPVLISLQAVSPGVSLLDIVVPRPDLIHVPALIHAAAALSPVDFRLSQMHQFVEVQFPQFNRAATADLRGLGLLFPGQPPTFPALQTLDLTDCRVHLPDLLLNCPGLRRLRANACMVCEDHVTIRSTALEELVVSVKDTPTNRIDVDAPALRKFTIYFHTEIEKHMVTDKPCRPSTRRPWRSSPGGARTLGKLQGLASRPSTR